MEKNQRKFKTRELTKNEKVLLSLLTVVILFWLSFRFIYTPQQEKLASLEAERLDYEMQIEEINTTLRKENQINEEWQELHREKEEIVSRYFPTLDQPQIIYLLNKLVENDNMFVPDLNFTRPSFTDIGGMQVRSMDISFPYSGKYQGVVDTLNSIKTSPRKMLVDNLLMDRDISEDLSGNMSLKIYSLEGIAESDSDVVFIDTAYNEEKESPFGAYDGYSEVGAAGPSGDGAPGTPGGPGGPGETPGIKPYIEETLLEFENRNNYFIPSQEYVKGDVSLSNRAKSKKHSLKLEYYIVAIDEVNMAFVDVTRNNIMIKYPPNTIGMWVFAYDYSPATLGIGFKDQMGEDVFVPLTEGIGWTGWKYVEGSPPTDLDIYPMKLENIYLEIPENREDFGILLLDKLEAVYNRNLGEDGSDYSISNHIFHVVQIGENLEEISKLYYGSNKYVNEIRSLNEIGAGDILKAGKILVLRKRYQLPFAYPDTFEKKIVPTKENTAKVDPVVKPVEKKKPITVAKEIPKLNPEENLEENIEHVVVKGDNISKISKKYYGTDDYMIEIMELNGIGFDDMLPIGTVLVLKKR